MSKRYTFEEPYISGGITREYKPKKLPIGFKPIFHETLKAIQNPSQAQLREFFGDVGQPRLYKSRGSPGPVIMNAMLRDYKTEKEISDMDVAKSHREHQYINSTETMDRLDAYAPDEKFNEDINSINQSLEKIYGLSKNERAELKKLLLKDVVSNNIDGLNVKEKKVKLPKQRDPDTGNDIENTIARLRNAPNLDEDKELINNYIQSSKKSSGKKKRQMPKTPTYDDFKELDDMESEDFSMPEEPTPRTKRRQTVSNFFQTLKDAPLPKGKRNLPPVPKFSDSPQKSIIQRDDLLLKSPATGRFIQKGSATFKKLVRQRTIVSIGDGRFINRNGEVIETK